MSIILHVSKPIDIDMTQQPDDLPDIKNCQRSYHCKFLGLYLVSVSFRAMNDLGGSPRPVPKRSRDSASMAQTQGPQPASCLQWHLYLYVPARTARTSHEAVCNTPFAVEPSRALIPWRPWLATTIRSIFRSSAKRTISCLAECSISFFLIND